MTRPPYTLAQMCQLLECHPRTLRDRMKFQPSTMPPFKYVQVGDGGHYEFDHDQVEVWLLKREQFRKETRRPWLRWLDPAENHGGRTFTDSLNIAKEQRAQRVEKAEQNRKGRVA